MITFGKSSFASPEKPLENYKIEVTEITKVSPLCLAISKGDIATVKKFIELGSNVNEKSRGMTPLMYAARYNKAEIIKLLIANGAKLKIKDDKGFTLQLETCPINGRIVLRLPREDAPEASTEGRA